MSRLNSNNKNNYNLPDPPPGAHPVQLELWRRVFQRRYRQIEALSPSIFITRIRSRSRRVIVAAAAPR